MLALLAFLGLVAVPWALAVLARQRDRGCRGYGRWIATTLAIWQAALQIALQRWAMRREPARK